ncbi:MAG: aminotransferase class IV [Sedimentisphaerales bacterium]|nr:aminotransferase class IV [Sedimentisphaerales bacterium]
MQIVMINDKIVPIEEIGPEYLDRGIFFGDGVYEVLRSYSGKIFAFDDHLARFERSLDEIQITGVDIQQVRSRVLMAFEKAGFKDARIYFHITRGSGPRDHLPDKNARPNFFLTVSELKDNSKLKAEGVAVSTYPDLRWKRCDIKSLNLLPNVLARMDSAKKGCWEAIFVDDAGLLTEGAGSAFFGIVNGVLRTSSLKANILPSVTRKYVIMAANNIGLKVVEKSLKVGEAAKANELFLAVTTRDIISIVKFDGHPIADAKPGNWTKQLIEEFKKFIV